MTTMDFSVRKPAERLPVSPPPRQATRPLTIQRSVGNDYLQRSESCAEPEKKPAAGCTGGCGGCAMRAQVQAMLKVGSAGDPSEREADDVARQVTGGAPADVRRLTSGSPGAGAPAVTLPASTGRPLSPVTRAFMEPRFGMDFGDVRVHTGTEADRVATRIHARAFTHDRDVYLGTGESEHDHHLMAHELTHVVQQRGGTRAVQRAISKELDKIEDQLSYGFTDWAITDAEALSALGTLKTLPRFQQAAFFADPTFAARLRDNLPDNRVAELDALAAGVAGMTPPTSTVEDIQDSLSYGLFDWAITDRDATEALDMLKKLSGQQLATALAAVDLGRLMDNLPDSRKPELAKLQEGAFGTGGTRQTEEQQHPGTLIRSISFKSDHGMMKNNTEGWGNSGGLYGEPEWFIGSDGVVSSPVSQNRNTAVSVELGLNVFPLAAPAAPVRLIGRSPEAGLNFEFTGTMSGGNDRRVAMTSTGVLPNTIADLSNREIAWELEWRNWKHEVARTRHTVYVTAGTPLAPGEVTEKRMRTAVAMTGEVVRLNGSLDPHATVRGIMRRWTAYNLDVQLANAWELADNLDVGAQCIDIVRFVQGLLNTVGLPGSASAVVVWARPTTPFVPEENPWPHGGIRAAGPHPIHPTWFAGLMDANGCPNAYEAALRFEHGGVLRYYPGGVSMNKTYTTPMDVLTIFQCLAWLTSTGPKELNIEEIAGTYPNGHCELGPIRCH
jgi:hypothetical protein